MEQKLLTRESVAKRWDISVKTLDHWRWSGRGPHYIKIGREIFYRLSSIEHFEDSQERKSTSELPPRTTLALPVASKKELKLPRKKG